jgi:hypothetical protein
LHKKAAMLYLLLVLAGLAAILMAGRAHTRRLNELDNLHAMGFLNDPAHYRWGRRSDDKPPPPSRAGAESTVMRA